MFAWRPLNRAASWSAPSPGLPAGPDTSTRASDKSPVQSTMSYSHTDGDPPGNPFATLPTPAAFVHPHGFTTTAYPDLCRPQTNSESLTPSDPTKARFSSTQDEAAGIV